MCLFFTGFYVRKGMEWAQLGARNITLMSPKPTHKTQKSPLSAGFFIGLIAHTFVSLGSWRNASPF